MPESKLTRRASLLRFGGLIAALSGAAGWKITASDGAVDAVRCVLAPEMTEGPYYIPNEKVRRNINEGRPGTPLLLHLTVVDASTCRPIKGAAVDIWHADALGVYSGESVENTVGQTFMRGIQRTNAHGVASFQTVYPGWYRGRTVHIHVKVHIGGNVVHTGQLFFRDALTDAVYRATPYNSRPNRDTRNADDGIYRSGGRTSLLTMRKNTTDYVGSIVMGVRRR
jgi:protocatechuate 3,4-dioxygenase beta subunit